MVRGSCPTLISGYTRVALVRTFQLWHCKGMVRIEDYAVVGDLHTAALVSTEGSIDWLCLPRFDSPACFNALLDTPESGRWRLAPAGASGISFVRCRRIELTGPSELVDPT